MRRNVLFVLAALLAETPLLWPPPFRLTDHLLLWQVGRFVVTGVSPYRADVWLDAATRLDSPHIAEIATTGVVWPYPPWTGLLFVPFGALPMEIGTWALHVAYLASGLLGAILLVRELPWSRAGSAAVAVTLFVVFEPFVIAARWGQFGGFLLLGVALLLSGLRARRLAPTLAGALLLATKPHLTALFALGAAAWLIRERRWRELAISALALVSVVTVTWLAFPEWLAAAGGGAGDRLSVLGMFASTWAFAIALAGRAWPLLAAILVTFIAASAVYAVRAAPPAVRPVALFAATGVLTLGLTPYALLYDDLLLAPALLYAAFALDRASARARVPEALFLALAGIALPWALYLVAIQRPDQAPAGAIPVLFAALLLAGARLLRPARDHAPEADERDVPQHDRRGEHHEEESEDRLAGLVPGQGQR